MKDKKERRASPRVEVNGELLLDIHSENLIKTDTVNISSSGINFASAAAIPLFRKLEIKLTITPKNKCSNVKTVRCNGVVVRCVKKGPKWFDVALFFVDMDKQARAAIEEYVDFEHTVKSLLK